MNARRDSSRELPRGSFGGRALLGAAVLFAVGATGVLILSDELKWLRLGIVAALWAALAGAFLAARYRRQVADQEEAAIERQERYELELEREIAARREYELEVAAEARRQAEESSRDDIAALRQELVGLRQTLESLLGGEFLVERYALRAESTRMRSLPDDRQLKRLPPAQPKEGNAVPAVVQDAPTDLIERVQEAFRAPKRTVDPLPKRQDGPGARYGQHPAELSDRWFVPDGIGTGQEPPATQQPTRYVARDKKDARRRPETAKPADAAQPRNRYGADREPTGGDRSRRGAEPTGTANRHSAPSGYLEPVSRPGANAPPAPTSGQPPMAGGDSSGYLVTPRPSTPSTRAEASGYVPPVGRPASRSTTGGFGAPMNGAESSGHGPPVRRSESSGFGPSVNRTGAGRVPSAGRSESSGFGSPVARPESSGYGSPVRRPESSGYTPPGAQPESGHAVPVDRGEPDGRRRAKEPEPETGGGRRRRAEGQPTWQESRQSAATAQPDTEPPSGSHAAGRSVNELLASHGGNAASPKTPRRRRRRED